MTQLSPDFLAKSREVFNGTWPTLETVRQIILSTPPSNRRRDALSAFGALRSLFVVDLATTPATFPVLRRIFVSRNPAQLALSPKRFANIRSEVFRAVREFGIPSPNLTKSPEITVEWQALLVKCPDKNYRASLGRLGRFCSAMNIAPADVGREALLGLYEALQAEGGVKDPHLVIRHVTSYWNFYEKRIQGWPAVRLKTPFAKNHYLLALADLPMPLRKDLARWQHRRTGGDLLSLDKVAHKSRPETVRHQTGQLLRYLGLLVRHGLANIEDFTSLSKICEPTLVQAAVTILLKERKLTIGYVHNFAYVLSGIARHETDLPKAKIQQLATLAANLKHETKKGMTKKNRSLLRQFDSPVQVQQLMSFPDNERKRGADHPNPYRQAKCFERALAADLLIHGALRIRNVVMLRLDRNMRKRGASYILTYTGEEMKTGHEHEIELPEWLTEHIEEFKKLYRPRLEGHEGLYLFPGKVADGHRHHSSIRHEFCRHVLRRTGLKVHPHFMRHLTSKLILDEDPSLLKVVSNRLGHTTTETAQTTYLETDSLSASRRANAFLSKLGRKERK